MAIIAPFRGVRYNPSKISTLADVITPPYDVISVEKQRELYRKSTYNLIQLEYGLEYAGDTEESNRYTRAAETFKKWLDDGILVQEKKPVFYWYELSFSRDGVSYRRHGLISSLKVEPYEHKSVIPHEETLSRPKADRLKLISHCKANFSPIFTLYSDPDRVVEQKCSSFNRENPALSFVDREGQEHRLWLIEDESICAQIQRFFSGCSLFLADGHHRYETALAYAREMESRGLEGYDSVLAVAVNLFSPGLLILPTHRIIKGLSTFSLPFLLRRLEEDFEVHEYSPAVEEHVNTLVKDLKENHRNVFSLGICTAERLYRVTMKKTWPEGDRPLDAALLQELVLEKALGLTLQDLREGNHLIYTQDETEALQLLQSGEAQVSFLLNPPPIEQVVSWAEKGQRLPQKSTYFYPKLISGLVIKRLGDEK